MSQIPTSLDVQSDMKAPQLGDITLFAALRGHAFVDGLHENQVARLAALATDAAFVEDDVILVAGQRSTSFYLLLEGSVAVELRTANYSVCVQALGAGHAFGWSSLLDHENTHFQVRARERTRALRLDGAALAAECVSDPELGCEIYRRALEEVAGRVKATELRFAEMCGVRV